MYNFTIMGAPIRELTASHRLVCLFRVERPAAPLSKIAEALGYSYGHTSQILCSPAKEYMRELEDRIVAESIERAVAVLVPNAPVVAPRLTLNVKR